MTPRVGTEQNAAARSPSRRDKRNQMTPPEPMTSVQARTHAAADQKTPPNDPTSRSRAQLGPEKARTSYVGVRSERAPSAGNALRLPRQALRSPIRRYGHSMSPDSMKPIADAARARDLRHVDARIGLLGDPHAHLLWTSRAVGRLAARGVRQIHVLGDFGFVWHGAPKERRDLEWIDEVLETQGVQLLITGGNHEGYDALERDYPQDRDGYRSLAERIVWLPPGSRGATVAGTTVASLGGANSIDRPRRQPSVDGGGGSWWPQEQITDADLAALGTAQVDVLLAHDAPITAELIRRLEPSRHRCTTAGLAYANVGQRKLQRAVEQVRPRLVVSGHYHLHLDATETLNPLAAEPFEMRSVILSCSGEPASVAVRYVDAGAVEYVDI